MKKILVAVDSFKGSLSSIDAGRAIERGIKSVMPDCQIRVKPVADGGEGTTDAIIYRKNGIRRESCIVTGPLGDKLEAQYITYESDAEEGRTAVMEMSAAAGLPLVPEKNRNPMHTTTYGVGEMIRDAVCKGCRKFIIGIGGSATNDGGLGMLQAFGFSCLDQEKNEVPYGAEGLGMLAVIEYPDENEECTCYGCNAAAESDDSANERFGTQFAQLLSECTFKIACDVTNPLVGELGCSRIFAPQKGADAEMVEIMELYMTRYADIAESVHKTNVETGDDAAARMKENHASDRYTPGAGAAGGLGYAFMMFLNAQLMPGIDIVLDETRLEDDVRWADTVITGEGRIDAQTMMGKTPAGVAKLARKYGKYVIAIGGCFGDGADRCVKEGIFNECYAVNTVLGIDESDAEALKQAMEHDTAEANLEKCAARICSLKKKLSDRVCRPAGLR